MSIYWCSLPTPRGKLRGMRSLSMFKEGIHDPKKEKNSDPPGQYYNQTANNRLKGNKITHGEPAV
jgi:hypothetical protein